jgi:hypothetical protein
MTAPLGDHKPLGLGGPADNMSTPKVEAVGASDGIVHVRNDLCALHREMSPLFRVSDFATHLDPKPN